MNKKSLTFLFLLTLHLAIGLKSSDFCILKQEECKGFNIYVNNFQYNHNKTYLKSPFNKYYVCRKVTIGLQCNAKQMLKKLVIIIMHQ